MDDLIERADAALAGVTPGPWARNPEAALVEAGGRWIARTVSERDASFFAAARELVPEMRDRIATLERAFAEECDFHARTREWAEELEAAGEALIRIVEGIDGAMEHGIWRASRSNTLMKDTPEWVALYCAIRTAPNAGAGK